MSKSFQKQSQVLNAGQAGSAPVPNATQSPPQLSREPQADPISLTSKNRTLCIRKRDLSSGKLILDLKIPSELVPAGLRLGASFGLNTMQLQEELLSALSDSSNQQIILDFIDEMDNIQTEIILV